MTSRGSLCSYQMKANSSTGLYLFSYQNMSDCNDSISNASLYENTESNCNWAKDDFPMENSSLSNTGCCDDLWPRLLLEDWKTATVPTPTCINYLSSHVPTNTRGIAGETEIWLLKNAVTVRCTCDFRARGGGRAIFIVFCVMNFRFWKISIQM